MTCRRIFELSTHVTKSSKVRETKNAGSLTTSVPTRTWPCSIKSVAFLMISDMLSVKQTKPTIMNVFLNKIYFICIALLLTITTGKRLRQKLLAEIFTAFWRSHFVGINPSTYNFSRRAALISVRNGSFASISLIFLANSRIVRDNLLYLNIGKREKRNGLKITLTWISMCKTTRQFTLCNLHVCEYEIFASLWPRANCCRPANS